MTKYLHKKLLTNILRFPISRNGWPFLVATLTFLLVEYLAANPSVTEKSYSGGIYPEIAAGLSFVSNLVPFSIWDIFWIGLIVAIFLAIFLLIFRKLRFWISLLRFFQFAVILYAMFYFVWGFNYFRNPIEKRMNWEKVVENDERFLAVFDTLIGSANQSRTEISIADYPQIDQAIEKSYQKNAKILGISYPNGSRRAKTMLLSSFFAKSGVSGYYGPFFSEVHVNGKVLPTEYPFVLAHEKAHQFGITGEAEANFVAWYVCATSDDQRLKYSGNLILVAYFLSDAFAMKDIKKYLKRFDKKALDDILAQRNHWREMRNATLDKAQTAANDAYLKSNKIDEGVKNYSSVVSMAITWYYNQDGKH